jgi:tetratricopeptide repeat protein 8
MPLDQLWLARSKLERNRLDECIEICDSLLTDNPGDQAAWYVKCKAVIRQNFIDDIELEEESFAEVLMDENAIASVPRPGTSLSAPKASKATASGGAYDQGIRPVSNSGRPMTGFARPGSSRPMSGSTDIRDALQSSRRIGTASGGRPMTNMGREIRLGTASLAGRPGDSLVNLDKLNIKKYAAKPGLAMILADYMLYVEHNTRKALEMCAEATEYNEYKSWWWKARLGKCYFKLGMLRDSEKQFRSSIKSQPIVNTYLELVNVYLRLDLPLTALDLLTEAKEKFPLEPRLILGVARIHEMLNDPEEAVTCYKQVLVLDASCVEAIACIGAHQFYSDQPEMAMRYYRRLLQMGVNNTELWNNIGLCCFYSSQYDMAIGCFDRALSLSSDDDMADVWYNIGHLGVALGDHGLAYQAFKVAVSVNPAHAEALNNLAILELRRYNNITESNRQMQALEQAKSFLSSATDHGPHLFEPAYNRALTAFQKQGDFSEAKEYVKKALEVYPGHMDSKDLDKKLLALLKSE